MLDNYYGTVLEWQMHFCHILDSLHYLGLGFYSLIALPKSQLRQKYMLLTVQFSRICQSFLPFLSEEWLNMQQHSIQDLQAQEEEENPSTSHFLTYFWAGIQTLITNTSLVHTAVLDGDICIPCAVNLFQMKNMQIITYFPFKKLTYQGRRCRCMYFYYTHEDLSSKVLRSAYIRIDQGLLWE